MTVPVPSEIDAVYSDAQDDVRSAAIAAGHNPDDALRAWEGCVQHIRNNPATFRYNRDESPALAKRRENQQRRELRKAAVGFLGVSILAVLFSWALGRLLTWLVDNYLMPDIKTAAGTQRAVVVYNQMY